MAITLQLPIGGEANDTRKAKVVNAEKVFGVMTFIMSDNIGDVVTG